jgi:signal transduction histidine kinase
MQINIHKSLLIMTLLNIILVFMVIFVVISGLSSSREGISEFAFLMLLAISLISLSSAVISLLLLKPASHSQEKLEQTESSISDLNSLNHTLRAQRHDFMNHLQVVHSLIDLNEYQEANKYIANVYDSIEKVNSILKTGIPAVNAILEAKRRSALNKNIEVTIDIRTTLAEIPVPEWEICRVIGNLIDNAVNALAEAAMNRRLQIEIFEDIYRYHFRVTDNGPGIKPDLLRNKHRDLNRNEAAPGKAGGDCESANQSSESGTQYPDQQTGSPLFSRG